MGRRNLPSVNHRPNVRCVVAILGSIAFSAFPAPAQTPALRFEVADVHPTTASVNWDSREMSGGLMRGGLYHLRHATMLDLVRLAYGVDANKVIGGPNWLALDRFDIRAKVPAGTTAAGVKPMLQALLAERFGLVARNDVKPVQAWALTSGKNIQMKRADGAGDGRCLSGGSGDLVAVTCRNITMAAFVANMGQLDGAWYYVGDNLVADQTGLGGAWDFDLKYSRRWNTTVAGAEIVSLFDAIEKSGLKLDASKVPMSVIVVDSVNRQPTPNSPETDKAFPPVPTEFEVADVRPTDPDFHGDDYQVEDGGRVHVRGTTLQSLVADSWGITGEMIVGAPKFMDSERWDIVAKAPEVMATGGDVDTDFLRAMFRKLLTERFHLAVHYEERPMSAWVLTAPKPKLKKADPQSRSGCKEGPATLTKVEPRSTNPVLGRFLTCTNVSMAWFGQQLQFLASAYVHSEVPDATGLEGGWDFTLSFSKIAQLRGGGGASEKSDVSPASDPNGAISAPDAMEKQLGLKLELRKRPVRVLVIDHVETKPTDN